MVSDKEKTIISLKSHIFKAPKPQYLIPLIFVISLFISFLFSADWITVTILISGTAYLTIILDYLHVKIKGYYFPIRRIVLLDFMSVLFSVGTLIFLYIVGIPNRNVVDLLLLGFFIGVGLRYIVFYTFFSTSLKKLLLPTLYLSISLIIFNPFYGTTEHMILTIICTFVYLVSGIIFIYLSIKIFKNEFDYNPITFLRHFTNALSEESHDSKEMNDFFESIYNKERDLPVTVLSFKNEETEKTVVFPYVHPGPFGTFGSSNIPQKLSEYLDEDLLVFHTTSTHDENCGSEEDVKKIAEAIKKVKNDIKYNDKISNIINKESNGFNYTLQKFGNSCLVALSPTNKGFDDISFEGGEIVRNSLKEIGMEEVSVIDAHNHFDDDYTILEKEEIKSILPSIKESINELKMSDYKVGFSHKKLNFKSMGPFGVQVMMFDTDGKRLAYILMDGNNIIPELRNSITNALKDQVDSCVVCSTDNHIANANYFDSCPIGLDENLHSIVDETLKAVKEAEESLTEMKVGMKTVYAKLKTAGEGHLNKITEVINKSKTLSKYYFVSLLSASFIFSVFLFHLFLVFL